MLAGLIFSSIDFGRSWNEAISIPDLLKTGILGAIQALAGPLADAKHKRIPSALFAGAFSAQILLLAMLRVQQHNFNADTIIISFVAAGALFPAFLAFVDNLSEPTHEGLSYVPVIAGIGGIIGLTLCWLYLRLQHSFLDYMVMGGLYGISIWTAIGIAKRISIIEELAEKENNL